MTDSEDSDYFIFSRDFLPAILSAQDFLVTAISAQLGNKKFSEEILSDVTLSRIFQTSTFSRIRLDPTALGHDVWTLIAIDPQCITSPAFTATPALRPYDSIFRNDLTFVTADNPCSRLTAEEWTQNKNNPFANGHVLEQGESVTSYGYINYTDYTSTGYRLTAPVQEIEIRPAISQKAVHLRYAKVPTKPALITDSINFPMQCFDMFVASTLSFMSVKIGDKTTLQSQAMQSLMMMIQANT